MTSSGIEIIRRSIVELAEPIHVVGGTPSANALLVSRVVEAGPLIVLCPNDDAASEFAADLESLSMALGGPPIAVCQFPTWEQSPYSPIAPSIRTRLARAAVLSELSHGIQKMPQVIVTSIAALSQATCQKEEFEKYCILLK